MTRILPAVILIMVMLHIAVPLMARAEMAFSVGPASVDVALPAEGTATALVYITSDFDGELTVGLEDLPFRVQPERVLISMGDSNKPVELTFYGDGSVESGTYFGKVTFLTYASENVAYGVKIKANVTHTGGSGEKAGDNEEEGDSVIDAIANNYLIVILGVLVVVALVTGVLIGRRRRGC